MEKDLSQIIADLEMLKSAYDRSTDFRRRSDIELCYAHRLTQLESKGSEAQLRQYRQVFLTMGEPALSDPR